MTVEGMVHAVAAVIAPHLRVSVGPNPDCDTQNKAYDHALSVARTAIEASGILGLTREIEALREALRRAAWELTDKGLDREARTARVALGPSNEREDT
jgi:hypothetical protein